MDVGRMNGYRDTKLGALIGAVSTAACGASIAGIDSYVLKNHSGECDKVTRAALFIEKSLLSSSRWVVFGLAMATAVGATMGLMSDAVKAKKAKKAEKV